MVPGKSIKVDRITCHVSELAIEQRTMPSPPQEFVEPPRRRVERADRRRKRQAHMTWCAECRAGHERDAGIVEESLAQLDVGRNAFRAHGAFDVRKKIERAVGAYALEAGQGTQPREEVVVTPLEFGAHLADARLIADERF